MDEDDRISICDDDENDLSQITKNTYPDPDRFPYMDIRPKQNPRSELITVDDIRKDGDIYEMLGMDGLMDENTILFTQGRRLKDGKTVYSVVDGDVEINFTFFSMAKVVLLALFLIMLFFWTLKKIRNFFVKRKKIEKTVSLRVF
jgi:hypothetical protein